MTRTSPGTVDRNDLHALPSPHFTNDSDLDCIDMYMPSPNTLLATPNFAYPSIPTRSDALPIDLNHMAGIPQHDWTTQFEPISTQTGNIDPVDRWVSRIATDSSHIYPALQVAHTDGGTARAADAVASGSQGFGVPHSPFWAFASNRVSPFIMLDTLADSSRLMIAIYCCGFSRANTDHGVLILDAGTTLARFYFVCPPRKFAMCS